MSTNEAQTAGAMARLKKAFRGLSIAAPIPASIAASPASKTRCPISQAVSKRQSAATAAPTSKKRCASLPAASMPPTSAIAMRSPNCAPPCRASQWPSRGRRTHSTGADYCSRRRTRRSGCPGIRPAPFPEATPQPAFQPPPAYQPVDAAPPPPVFDPCAVFHRATSASHERRRLRGRAVRCRRTGSFLAAARRSARRCRSRSGTRCTRPDRRFQLGRQPQPADRHRTGAKAGLDTFRPDRGDHPRRHHRRGRRRDAEPQYQLGTTTSVRLERAAHAQANGAFHDDGSACRCRCTDRSSGDDTAPAPQTSAQTSAPQTAPSSPVIHKGLAHTTPVAVAPEPPAKAPAQNR